MMSAPCTATMSVANQKEEERRKKKKLGLPWGCQIVAWILLVLTCLTCIAFVTFYGISFADVTCRKWISSMLVSFFMSVFVTQPLKVLLMAVILALLLKPLEDEKQDDEVDEERNKLGNDETPLHLLLRGEGIRKRLNFVYSGDDPCRNLVEKEVRTDRKHCLPLEGEQLILARERRLQEVQMWRVLREVLVYVIFIIVLLLICYRDRSSNTFLYKDTMRRTFIQHSDVDFETVTNTLQFWEWARTGLVNGLRAGPYYNNLPPVMLRGYVNDKESKILGYATMRQLRIKTNQCRVDRMMKNVVEECNTDYQYWDHEKGTFDIGWKPLPSSQDNDTAEWYRYTHGETLNSYPYLGKLALYSGGGYVASLRGSKTTLLTLLTRLQDENWIDKYTRAVFIEFTIYNAQVNLFGIARILAEFHRTGGVVPSYRFEAAMLLPYATTGFYVQMACEVIFCLFILVFAIRLVMALFKEKRAFFQGFWNLVELCIVALSVAAAVVYFYRLFETSQLTEEFHKTDGLSYVNFQYVGYWNEIFGYMLGFIVFLAILKFLRLLRFNRRMSLLAATLQWCARSLLQLGLVLLIFFVGFVMLFYLLFLSVDTNYSTFIGSAVATVLMIMGKMDLDTFVMAEPVIAPIVTFLYTLTITFILLNMLITILNEGFGAVRGDLSKQPNDHEIVDFLLARLKSITGMRKGHGGEKRGQEGEVGGQAQNDHIQSTIDHLQELVDRMFELVNRNFPVASTAPLATSFTKYRLQRREGMTLAEHIAEKRKEAEDPNRTGQVKETPAVKEAGLQSMTPSLKTPTASQRAKLCRTPGSRELTPVELAENGSAFTVASVSEKTKMSAQASSKSVPFRKAATNSVKNTTTQSKIATTGPANATTNLKRVAAEPQTATVLPQNATSDSRNATFAPQNAMTAPKTATTALKKRTAPKNTTNAPKFSSGTQESTKNKLTAKDNTTDATKPENTPTASEKTTDPKKTTRF